MTLPTNVNVAGPFDGDDSTTKRSFSFKITVASQLVVTHTDSAGVEQTLVNGTDYDIDPGSIDNTNGGSITTKGSLSPAATGEKTTLSRIVPLTQLTDITTGGKFDPKVHEDTFDIITMGLQQLDEKLDRAFVLPISDGSATSPVFPIAEASKLIGWTSTPPFALRNYDAPGVTLIGLEDIDNTAANELDIIQQVGGALTYVAPSAAFANISLTSLSTAGAVVQDVIVFDGMNADWGTLATPTIDLTTDVTGILPDANTANDLTISAGTVDNSPIGLTTPSTGAFTTISATTSGQIGTAGTEFLGIGLARTEGLLHVHEGTAGVITAGALADLAVFESNVDAGISILSPDNRFSSIYFGSPSGDSGALIDWKFDDLLLRVQTNTVGASLELGADADITNLTLSGGAGSELATFVKDVTLGGIITAGSGSTVLTNGDGTIREAAINSAIAGAGITYTSGVLSVSGGDMTGPGPTVTDEAVAIFDGTGGLTVKETAVTMTVAGAIADAISLHIKNGSSGATASTSFDEVVIESNLSNMGISLIGSLTANIGIAFGTSDDSIGALVQYTATSSDVFRIGTSVIGASTILAGDNDTTNLTLSGAAGSELATFEGDITMSAGDLLLSAGTQHNINGSSGATASTGADELVVESSGVGGISILTPNATSSRLYFGSPTDPIGALLDWNYNAGSFAVFSAKVGASLRLAGDDQVLNLRLSGGVGNELATFEGAIEGATSIHIQNGASGASAATSADDLIVETNGITGVSILAPAANSSNLFFGSPTDNVAGALQFIHSTGKFNLATTTAGDEIVFQADSTNTNLTLSGGAGSELATFEGDIEIGGLIDMVSAMGSSTVNPSTHNSPDDWLEIKVGGTSFFAPLYNAT